MTVLWSMSLCSRSSFWLLEAGADCGDKRYCLGNSAKSVVSQSQSLFSNVCTSVVETQACIGETSRREI